MCQKPHYCKSQTDLEVQCNQFKLQQTFEMKLTRFFFFFKFHFIFARDRDSTSGGGAEREGDKESQAGSR